MLDKTIEAEPGCRGYERPAISIYMVAMLVALALPVAASSAAADAAELAVTRSDDPVPDSCRPADCSLREAVIAADGRGGADTIRLAPGTYTLSRPRPGGGDFGFAQVGDLDVGDDLTIEGPPLAAPTTAGGGTRATIDGNGAVVADRVLEADAGASLTLRRLRIVGGEAQPTEDENDDGVPDFALGGAVRIDPGATLDLEHAALALNRAETFGVGGAIYNAGTLRAADSRFTLNEAAGGFSGAIHTLPGASAELTRVELEANVAAFGGALGDYGLTSVEDSALLANHAEVGGAIRAGGGGSLTTLVNVTLAHNDSRGDGAAIRARDGAGLFLDAVTIARNVADMNGDGSGDAAVSLQRDALATSAELRNTILADNEDRSPAIGIPDCEVAGGAAIVFAGYDLLGDRHGCELSIPLGTKGNQLPNSGFTLDPRLAPAAAANGGPTRTLALLAGSPAIDAGDPAPPGAAAACPAADQRGAPRASCDIGAYELQAPEVPAAPGSPAPTGATPGSPGTTGPPSANGQADTSPPAISHASLSRRRFRVGRAPAAPMAPIGTRVRFGLSETSRVTLAVERLLPGRRVRRGGAAHCARPAPRLRHDRRCTRRRRAGALRRDLRAGQVAVPFSGRIARRALRPGRYRLLISATDAAGNRSRTTALPFTIVGP